MDGDSERLPGLVIVFGYRSLDAMTLRAAARGWCRVIWLIDARDEFAAALEPLLSRSGPVVSALGLSVTAAADLLAVHQPDGIVTFYDAAMEKVAAIAAELGLPFNSPLCALRLEDKLHQRAAFAAGGLPTPEVLELPADAEAREVAAVIVAARYPAILKPRRASGSWHTFRVDTPAELAGRLRSLAGEPEERIVESFLPDGPPLDGGFEAGYVSVESIAVNGVITHLAVTGRLPLVEPLRETGFFIPSTLAPEATREVLNVATRALAALEFRWGAAHTEVKLTADGPRVIEVNGRIGGGVPEMLALATGIDIVVLAMRAALGFALELAPGSDTDGLPATNGVAYRFFYQPPVWARKLVAIDGLGELRQAPGVQSLNMHHGLGTSLDATHGTRTFLFAMVGWVHDHAGVAAMSERLEREVTATYEP